MAEEKEKVERAARQAEDQRNRETQAAPTPRNLLWPQYERDVELNIDREVKAPSDALFMGLGWDEDATTKRKHYRKYYPKELEKVKELMPKESPFNSYNIKRGQVRGNKKGGLSLFKNKTRTDESGSVSTDQVMGKFKAVVEVEVIEHKKAYVQKKEELINNLMLALGKLHKFKCPDAGEFSLDLDKLESMEGRWALEAQMEPLGVAKYNITKCLADIQSDIFLQNALLHQEKCIVRAYMISAYDLASRDIGSASDPYLILQVGDKTYSERDNYVLDEPNPQFAKHYDFETEFPGCP